MSDQDSKTTGLKLSKVEASQVSDTLNSASTALLEILRLWAASEMTTDSEAAEMIKTAAESYALAIRRQIDAAIKLFPDWVDLPF